MTRDELLKGCMPAGVCMNPIGRNLNELSVEEFEQNYKTIFKSVFEIGQADISAFNGFGELDEDNQPQSKTLKEFLVDTFDDEGDDYWYHWKELFETSRMTKEFFDRYYEKMLQYMPYCEEQRYLVNNNTFFANMIMTEDKVGFPDWSRVAIVDYLLDFAIMDLNKPYLKIPEKLWAYCKENNIEIPNFKERFLCMAYYKGIDTLRWHASIDDEESCKSIMDSLEALETRIMAL